MLFTDHPKNANFVCKKKNLSMGQMQYFLRFGINCSFIYIYGLKAIFMFLMHLIKYHFFVLFYLFLFIF